MGEYPADPTSAAGNSVGAVVNLTPLGRQYLNETRPWVRLMSILCFVGAALLALLGVGMLLLGLLGGMALGGSAAGSNLPAGLVGGVVMSVVYFTMGVAYVVPGVFLYRYASAIERLQTGQGDGPLEDALKYQRSFWRFAGIATVLGILLAVVCFFVAIAFGVLSAMAGS